MKLEACVGNVQDALSAQQRGAHQIELCDRLDLDGTSPPLELVSEVVAVLDIPVKVIINPHSLQYQYSDAQQAEIMNYIEAIGKYQIAGIVYGPIDQDGMPDLLAIAKMAEHTTLPITYHKAIDASPDIIEATRVLAEHGRISSILSSGGFKTAWEGRAVLSQMYKLLENSDIELIGAGRITDENIAALHSNLELNYYHGKLIVGELG